MGQKHSDYIEMHVLLQNRKNKKSVLLVFIHTKYHELYLYEIIDNEDELTVLA